METQIRLGIIGPCPPPFGGVTRVIENNLNFWKVKNLAAFFIPIRVPQKPEPPEGATFIDYRKSPHSHPFPIYKVINFLNKFPLTRIENYINFYQFNCALAKIIEDHKLNLLYAHHTGATGLSAVLQTHIYGIPCVIVSYGQTWLVTEEDRRYKRMAQFILQEASWVVSTSEHCRQGALRLGADPYRSSVVYAGIDLKKFRPDLDGLSYRNKLGIPLEDIVISILGLALRRKIDTFLEAIQMLKGYPQLTFLIGGVGEDFIYLQGKISELNLNKVKLMGFVPEKELPLFYAATDILVASPKTLTECMGQSIKEAMSCSKPTVVADIGGGPEAISHMENGLLFEAGNTVALKIAVEKLIADPGLRKKIGERAIATATEKFDAQRCSEQTWQIFQQLLRESSTR